MPKRLDKTYDTVMKRDEPTFHVGPCSNANLGCQYKGTMEQVRRVHEANLFKKGLEPIKTEYYPHSSLIKS